MNNQYLLCIPQNGISESKQCSASSCLNGMNLRRALEYIYNLSQPELPIKVDIKLVLPLHYCEELYSTESIRMTAKNFGKDDIKTIRNVIDSSTRGKSVEVNIVTDSLGHSYDHIVSICTLLYATSKEQAKKSYKHLNDAIKEINTLMPDNYEAKQKSNCPVPVHYIMQTGIQLRHARSLPLLFSVIDYINVINAATEERFQSSFFRDFNERNILRPPICANIDIKNLNHIPGYSAEGTKEWPSVDMLTNKSGWLCLKTYNTEIGRITVNDFGPNRTMHGFRDEINNHSNDNRPVVIITGGSFSYGHNLVYSDTIGAQIQKILSSVSKFKNLKIINLSGCKDNSFDQLVKLAQFIDLIKPEAVVNIVGFNDTLQLTKSWHEFPIMSTMKDVFGESKPRGPFINPLPYKIYNRINQTCAKIHSICNLINASCISFLQPIISNPPQRLETSSYALQPRLDRSYALLAEICRKEGSIIKMEIYDKGIELAEKDLQKYFIDYCHSSQLGAFEYAKVISHFIQNK